MDPVPTSDLTECESMGVIGEAVFSIVLCKAYRS